MNFKKIWSFLEEEYNYRNGVFGERKGETYFKTDVFLDIVGKYKFIKVRKSGASGSGGEWHRLLDHMYELKTNNGESYYMINPYLSKEEVKERFDEIKLPENMYDIWNTSVYAFSTVIIKKEAKKHLMKAYGINMS